MDIIIKGHEYIYDITSILLLFFPGEKATFVSHSQNDTYIRSELIKTNDKQLSKTTVKFNGKIYKSVKTEDLSYNSKDLVKFSFYKVCKKATGIESDWGILTGIRPLSVYEKIRLSGNNPKKVYHR